MDNRKHSFQLRQDRYLVRTNLQFQNKNGGIKNGGAQGGEGEQILASGGGL
jgi:hypothetical protein